MGKDYTVNRLLMKPVARASVPRWIDFTQQNDHRAQEDEKEHLVLKVSCSRILYPETERYDSLHTEHRCFANTGFPSAKEK